MVQQPRIGYAPERVKSRVLKKYLRVRVHSSLIHKSQKVGATQVSTDG